MSAPIKDKKIRFAFVLISFCLAGLVLAFYFFDQRPGKSGSSNERWPTREWQTSTPEEQGMDSEVIYNTITDLINSKADSDSIFDSILIVRNGYIVVESYGPVTTKDSKLLLHSATKSITSALVGIAIHDGSIKSVDSKLLSLIPRYSAQNVSTLKEKITVKDLLTMSAGFEWNEFGVTRGPDDSAYNMYQSGNLVQYAVDQPVIHMPGTTFNYNSGGSILLSEIVAENTHSDTLAFAARRLFAPLGITDYDWRLYNGTANGATFLYLTARDMAKIGYLYLKQGQWDGQQVIPVQWIKDSTTKQIDEDASMKSSGYGYQWWLNSFGGYSARGQYGQYLFVMPELNMVAVFQSHLSDRTNDFKLPLSMMEYGIIKSVKSNRPLPPNARRTELEKAVKNQAIPQDWRKWE